MAEGGDLQKFMIMLLTLSIFAMTMGAFIGDIETNYGLTGLNESVPEGSTYFTNTSGIAADIEGDLDTEIVGDQGEDNLLTATWKMLKKVYGGINIMSNIINDLVRVLPLPEELQGVAGAFIGIVTIIVIFGIMGVVTRTRSP